MFFKSLDHSGELIVEDSHEKEDGSRTSSHSHDADDEPVEDPTVTELKSKLRDAQAKANSYRDKAEAATDRVSLFQDEVAEITKEAISLKTQLEESLKEKNAMTKTIDELKSKVVEGESESDKAKLYHERALEATKEAVSLKAELRESKARQASMETTIDELKKEAEEYQKIKNTTAAAAGDEEEPEASKRKVKELEEMVDSMKAEQVDTQEQLASHVKVISDFTATERDGGGIFPNPNSEHLLLLEATQKLKLKDYEVRNLNEKILSLESKLRSSNGDHGSSTDDSYRTWFHELQKSYNGVVAQNEDMYRQLHSTRKTNEQLKNQKEVVTKKELERVASMKQYQKELDARDDHVFFLEKHTEELEKKLQKAQQELDAAQQEKVGDMGEEGTAAKTQQQVLVLQNRVAELEEKLQIADARRYKDKDVPMADESGVEEKSGRGLSSLEATAPSSSSTARNTCCCSTPKGIAPTDITGQRRQPPYVAFKYAVGVAFLSLFLGFLLLRKHCLSG